MSEEKLATQIGIINEQVDPDGRLAVTIANIPEPNGMWNGRYVFDVPRNKYRDIVWDVAAVLQKSKKWELIAQEIAKKRKIQVRQVVELAQDGELTEDEVKQLNNTSDNEVNLKDIYRHSSSLLLAFVKETPTGVILKTYDDFENMPMSMARMLYDRCMLWAMSGIAVSGARRKK